MSANIADRTLHEVSCLCFLSSQKTSLKNCDPVVFVAIRRLHQSERYVSHVFVQQI